VGAAHASRVCAVVTVLAEEVLTLLTLHDSSLLLTLLAHDDACGLADDIYLVLLLADLPQKK